MMSYQAPAEFGPMLVRSGKIENWAILPVVMFYLILWGIGLRMLSPIIHDGKLFIFGSRTFLVQCLLSCLTLMVLERIPAFGEQFLIHQNGFIRINRNGKQRVSFADAADFSHRIERVKLGRRQVLHHLCIHTETKELSETIQQREGSWNDLQIHAVMQRLSEHIDQRRKTAEQIATAPS